MAALVLDSRYAEILAFEGARTWESHGHKESVVRERFDVGMSRYYQLLNHAIDLPAAHRFDPTTVARLQRLRDLRSSARPARKEGFTP